MAGTGGLRSSIGVFRTILRNRDLRRLLGAFAGFCMGEWATWVAIMVFAFQRGGATEAGVVALIQLAPSAVVAPFASVLGDWYRRERFLLGGYLTQAVTMAATASAMLAGAPAPVVYVLAASVATSVTLSRPAQGALLPGLVERPEELTAANVAAGTIEGLAFLAGPAVAAGVMAAWGAGQVFAVMAGVLGLSSFLAWGIRRDTGTSAAAGSGRSLLRTVANESLGGFRALREDRSARLVVGLLSGQSFVIGALDVLEVALALSVLHLGPGGPGFLASVLGGGGLAGAMVSSSLIGGRRLAGAIGVGILLLGVPVSLIAVARGRWLAALLVLVAGAGRTILDVAGRTLLQRVVPDRVLSRVFGILEGLQMAFLGVGSLAAAAAVAGLGVRGAFAVVGAALPLTALLLWSRIVRADAAVVIPRRRLELLRGIAMFAPLRQPELEQLAKAMVPVEVSAGTVVIRQGEPGDRFYVVDRGEVEVSVDGRAVGRLGPGAFFGEIALLRDEPRSATVTAVTDASLFALDRDPFLGAVTGHPAGLRAADEVIRTRLHRS